MSETEKLKKILISKTFYKFKNMKLFSYSIQLHLFPIYSFFINYNILKKTKIKPSKIQIYYPKLNSFFRIIFAKTRTKMHQ